MMINEEPLVSVVLPVKNGENTIKNSINSVLEQSYRNLELIVVVNGCTDRTLEEVESVKDDRVKLFHSGPGVVAAMNVGLKYCSGEFIARQDADDFWYPDKIKKQIKFLSENEEIDILGTQMLIMNSGKKEGQTNYPLDDLTCKKWIYSANNPIGNPSVVYRKKVLEKVGGYWEFFPLAEDMEFFFRCALHYKMSNLPTVEMIYNYVPKQNYDARVPRLISQFYGEIYRIINEWNS